MYSLGGLERPLVLVVECDLAECVGGEVVDVVGLAPLVRGDVLAPEGRTVVGRGILGRLFRHGVGHDSCEGAQEFACLNSFHLGQKLST